MTLFDDLLNYVSGCFHLIETFDSKSESVIHFPVSMRAKQTERHINVVRESRTPGSPVAYDSDHLQSPTFKDNSTANGICISEQFSCKAVTQNDDILLLVDIDRFEKPPAFDLHLRSFLQQPQVLGVCAANQRFRRFSVCFDFSRLNSFDNNGRKCRHHAGDGIQVCLIE